MIAQPKLTLVIFSWCPRGGVGSRRWSKFAKYLSYEKIATNVITTDYPIRDLMNWCHEIENNELITSTRTPLRYPIYFLRRDRNFLVKLGDRVLSRTTHGIDPAQRWALNVPEAIAWAKDDQSPIVLSVPPFSMLLCVPELRKRFVDRRIILDYRDPWSYFAPAEKLAPGGAYRAIESAALSAASEVWCITQEHKEMIMQQYDVPEGMIHIVPNGFDPADYESVEFPSMSNRRAVYAGHITDRRLASLVAFLEALERKGSRLLREEFRVDYFYVQQLPTANFTPEQRRLIDKYVVTHGGVPAADVPQIIADRTFGIAIDREDYTLTIPTKNYDYLGLNRQIISLGPVASFHRAIQSVGHFVSKVTPDSLDRLVEDLNTFIPTVPTHTQQATQLVRKYSVPDITQRVCERLFHKTHA